MLKIKSLQAGFGDKRILNGVNLNINKGEVHTIMGPNGSGKSTLAKALIGHPDYGVIGGAVTLEGKSLLDMEPEDRALAGLFLSYQNPVEIPGVNNAEFLRMAYNSKLALEGKEELDPFDFDEFIEEKIAWLGLPAEFKDRDVNESFSGGEKKKNEILQMAVLDPKVAVLDEIDSGLDVDALKLVAENLNKLKNGNNAFLIITHYNRLLDYIKPDFVHIFNEGRIVKSGPAELALELEESGYDGVLAGGGKVER